MSDNNESQTVAKLSRLEAEVRELKGALGRVERDRIEFLQNVSHQLVAPLNAIKWHIENLTQGRLSVDRAKKVLRSVYSQATLAVHLAKNFNLMSNLEADHALTALKEPLQNVPLYTLLVNLTDDFQPLAWDRDIHIEVENAGFETAPAVLAMKPLITQVFSNIIENAVKYSDSSTTVDIRGGYDNATDSVSVLVRNRGIPLAAEHCKRVLERGFRSMEAKAKYPAGTGFGLYIADRIVSIHEGSIEASSTPPWVIFKVTLPVKALKGKARFRA